MNNISTEEIKTFGKILGLVGKLIEKDPELIVNLLKSSNKGKEGADKSSKSSEVKTLSLNGLDTTLLFDMAKEKSKEELINILKKHDANQLRSVIKQLSFGSIRSKSIPMLSEYIADQLKKRTTDVFRNHLSEEIGSHGSEDAGKSLQKQPA